MQISGLNLFPMTKFSTYLSGYYFDRNGNVYSIKNASGRAQLLGGSKQPSGHYFTLNKRSYRLDDLFRMAKAHKDFVKDTQATPIATTLPIVGGGGGNCIAGLPGRTKSAKQAVAAKGYVLATVGPTDKFVFSTDPVLHLGADTAKAEAVRIATMKPGTEVVVLQVVAAVTVGAAVWK